MEIIKMKKMIYIILLLPLIYCTSVFGETAVCLYSQVNYQGSSHCISSNKGMGSRIKLTGFNDIAKSIAIRPGFKVVLYEHYDTPGNYIGLQGRVPDLGTFQSKASSITINTDITLNQYSACLYEHENYEGKVLCTKESVELSQWQFSDLTSSIKVNPNYELQVFEHSNQSGREATFRANKDFRSLNQMGFNDKISYIKVVKKASLNSPFDESTLNGGAMEFIIVSDPQLPCTSDCLTDLSGDEATDAVRKTVDFINRTEAKNATAVIINGDITSYGHGHQWDPAIEILNNFTIPYYFGLGNHDYRNNDTGCYQNNCYVRSMLRLWNHISTMDNSIYDARVEETAGSWKVIGSLGYAIDFGSIYYIQMHDHQIDNERSEDSINTLQRYETSDYNDANHCCRFYATSLSSTINFLRQQFEFAAQNNKIVILGRHRTGASSEVAQLIKDYNVQLVFAGHSHQLYGYEQYGIVYHNSGTMVQGDYIKLIIDPNKMTAQINLHRTPDGTSFASKQINLQKMVAKMPVGQGILVQ
jgi:predicted phosphodiesterase